MKRPATPTNGSGHENTQLARWLVALLCAATVGWTTTGATPARAESDAASPEAWIERMNRALVPGRSMTGKAVLTTTDHSGASNEIKADFARRTEADGRNRILIEVTAPESGKGTVYQINAAPGEALESWVWSPAVGRLRRIAGIHRTDPFLGSEFTYEDLGFEAPEEHSDGVVVEVVEGDRRWILVDSGPYHYYGRVQTYLDPDTAMPHRVVYYDLAGQPFREKRFLEINEVGGYPFPRAIEVEDRLTGTTSRLVFHRTAFDVDVADEHFADSVVRERLNRAPHD